MMALQSLNKYYLPLVKKPAYILVLGMALFEPLGTGHNLHTTVFHPYFKINYIKLSSGGPEAQKVKREAGDPFAKNWPNEAQNILEDV